MRRLLPFVLIGAVAAIARADEAPSRNGLILTPVFPGEAPAPLGGRTLWLDSQDRVIQQLPIPPFQGGGPLGKISCAQSGAAAATEIFGQANGVLAAGPASDDFIVLRPVTGSSGYTVHSVACGRAAQALGTYTFPAGLQPVPRGPSYARNADGDVVYATSTGVGRLVVSPSLAASQLVGAAELLAALGATTGTPTLHFVVPTADGRLFLGVDGVRPGTVLVERKADGTFVIHVEADLGSPPNIAEEVVQNAVFAPEWNAVLVDLNSVVIGAGRAKPALGVLPLGRTDAWGPLLAPWPTFEHGLAGGASGPVATSGGLWRVTVDPATADFDRDGLRASVESTLGTSDLDADSDDDGVGDGAEVLRFGTVASDAASVPDVAAADEVVLAETFLADAPPTGGPGPGLVREVIPEGVRITRYRADRPPFAVVDPSRPDCPILGNADDLPHCTDPKFASPRLTSAEIAGFEDGTAYVAVETVESAFLLAVDDERATFAADLSQVVGPSTVWTLPLKDVGSSGYLALQKAVNGSLVAQRRLDGAFRPVDSTQPFVSTARPFALGRHGFGLTQDISYLVEPYTGDASNGNCGGGGTVDNQVMYCDFLPPQLPRHQVKGPFAAEWVPVSPAIEKGEVITWSARRYAGLVSGIRNPRTGNYETPDEYDAPGWVLWRTTPLGATLEWLYADDFTAKLSATDRAVLDTTPLGPITSLGASPDGLALCLAEGGAPRTWELTLDASTRKLSGIRLADATSGAGCAYDEAGHLATLGTTPVAVHAGSTTLAVTGAAKPIGLYRIGARWIVQAAGEAARCVTDAGTIDATTVEAVAMSPVADGVAYIGADGFGFVTTAERFCSGQPPLEALSTLPDAGVWTIAHNPLFTFRSVEAKVGAMAVRPDGVVFLGASSISTVIGTDPEVIPRAYFAFFPAYRRLDPDARTEALDGLRLRDAFAKLASGHLVQVRAATAIPGAPKDRDWGYATRPGVGFDPPFPGPDAGSPSPDGGTGTPPAPTGCGCDGPAAAPLALAALFARRRRRAP